FHTNPVKKLFHDLTMPLIALWLAFVAKERIILVCHGFAQPGSALREFTWDFQGFATGSPDHCAHATAAHQEPFAPSKANAHLALYPPLRSQWTKPETARQPAIWRRGRPRLARRRPRAGPGEPAGAFWRVKVSR